MPGERKEGRREKEGSKKGGKKDKKERHENPARKEGRNALRKVASSIFAPAKTEPIWTLSEPVIKVFVNGGGGRSPPPTPLLFFFTPCRLVFKNPEPVIKMFAPPPPPPTPRFFCAMQAVFQENRTINKNCVKHVVVVAFLSHMQAVCLQMRGCVPANTPALFLSCARSLQLSS